MTIARKIWTVLIGIKDALALLALLLFFGVLFMLLASGPDARDNQGGALLLSLDGVIVEQTEAVDPRDVLLGGASGTGQTRLRDVIHALETAATDKDIKTVVLDLDGFLGGGQASMLQIGAALDKVRAAKKPVLTYATGYSDDSYTLAAHASEVWLDPMGGILFTGPGGSRPYFKGLAEKLAATIHVYRVGKYKSFVEPYVRDSASPEAKQEDQVLADALWSQWQEDVVKARPAAKVAAMAADPAGQVTAAGGELSKAALANGLVDKLGDRTAFGIRVAELAGVDDEKKPGSFKASQLAAYVAANPVAEGGSEIGIVTIAGEIVDGHAPAGMAGGDTITDLIDTALAERDLKALVVRVNSPGGSAYASEQMRRALMRVRDKQIPIVISMGNVAASGGYWVSMTGDTVFAEPSTITGSIGVFSIFPTFERTAAKAGVTSDGVRTTPLSGQPDLLGGTNEQTDRLMQAGVEDIYRRFTNLVAEKRKLALPKVLEVAEGRVWDGGTARQIGLVDRFGSLDDAVAEAARLASIEPGDVTRVWLEGQQSFVSALIGGLFGAQTKPAPDIFTTLAARQAGMTTAAFHDAARIASGPAIQLRCLSCPVVRPARTTASLSDGLAGLSRLTR